MDPSDFANPMHPLNPANPISPLYPDSPVQRNGQSDMSAAGLTVIASLMLLLMGFLIWHLSRD